MSPAELHNLDHKYWDHQSAVNKEKTRKCKLRSKHGSRLTPRDDIRKKSCEAKAQTYKVSTVSKYVCLKKLRSLLFFDEIKSVFEFTRPLRSLRKDRCD